MAIDNSRSRPHPLTLTIRDPASLNGTRCFHWYDKSKSNQATSTSRVSSILRRRTKYSKPSPLRVITSRVNNSPSSTSSFSCPSSAGKRIKIILHHNDDDHLPFRHDDGDVVPPSFTPPPPSNNFMFRPKAVTPPPPPTHKVSFYHKVQVLRIPSRKLYPEDVKKNLWASLSEITENAKRNSLEYTSEGWDWRTVLEEKDMYRHPRTGEYVHPVHVQREYQKRMMAAAARKRQREEEKEESESETRQHQPSHETLPEQAAAKQQQVEVA